MTSTQPTPLIDPVDGPADPIPPSDTVTVIAWHDATVEQTPGAMRTDSDDALVWYTPSIGTIGMAIAHRFARHATAGATMWTLDDIARTFGIGLAPARVGRSLDRLARFGIIHRAGGTLAVRLWLPPLTSRQRCQLPAYLADAYRSR